MRTARPRIYLAGPDVFFPEAEEIARARKAFLAELGLEGLFPLDNQILAATPAETSAAIFRSNCEMMDSADASLANLEPFRGPSADAGTCFEVGYFFAQRKPVVGYSRDLSQYREKVHAHGWSRQPDAAADRLGHEIEDFEATDNLMITEAVAAILPTFEEAALKLRDLLGVA